MSLHPIFSQALAPFAPAQQQHRASSGRRRVFLSAADAKAYDSGYALWPALLPLDVPLSSPMSTGHFDAEHDSELRDEAKAERWQEDRDAMDGGL